MRKNYARKTPWLFDWKAKKIVNLENTISNEANLVEHQSSEIQRLKDQNQILVEKIDGVEKKLSQFVIVEDFFILTKGLFLSAE